MVFILISSIFLSHGNFCNCCYEGLGEKLGFWNIFFFLTLEQVRDRNFRYYLKSTRLTRIVTIFVTRCMCVCALMASSPVEKFPTYQIPS